MQGTVWAFDKSSRSGHIVLDNGRLLDFSPEIFDASGLRLLRPGQRVRFVLGADDVIGSMTILTLADPDPCL